MRRRRFGSDGWTGLALYPNDANGIYVVSVVYSDGSACRARKFVAAFQARYQVAPTANSALGYDAMMLVADAIRVVGPDRRRIRDYLASSAERRPFAGVTGPIAFEASGDLRTTALAVMRLENAQFVVVPSQGTAQ